MQMSATLKTGQLGSTGSRRRGRGTAGLAEQAVGEVAGHAAQQQAERDAPTPVLPSRRLSHSTTHDRDHRQAR